MNAFIRWSLLIPLLFFFLQCQKEDDKVVARIEREKITVKELRDKLQEEYRGKNLADISLEDRQKTLEKLLEERRKVVWAIKNDYDKDPEYQKELSNYRKIALANELYTTVIVSNILPEALLKQYYEWKHRNVEAVALHVGYNQARIINNPRSLEEAETLARQYLDQLAASPDPQKTAEELTDNKRVSVLLKPYAIGRFATAVDSAVFTAAPGDVVGPIKTEDHGVMVLKILSVQPISKTGDYESVKGELQQTLRGVLRPRETELFDRYSKEFQQKHRLEISDAEIARFVEILRAWGEKPEHEVSDFTAEEREIALAKIDGKAYTAGDFIDAFKERLKFDYRKFLTPDELKNGFLSRQMNLEAWALESQKRGFGKREKVKEALEKFRVSRLSQMLEKHGTGQDIAVSEDEIVAYYNANQDKYKTPERIQVWQLPVKDEAAAREALRQAKKGKDFPTLFKSYGKELKGIAGRLDLSYQTRNSQFKEVVEKAFEIGPNQYAGPVLSGGNLYIIKTGEHQPELLKPLEEVRSSIHSVLTNQKRTEAREKLMVDIRKKYSYRINESILRSIS